MSAKKRRPLSVEACQRLWASVAINKNLSSEQWGELQGHLASIWPGRRLSSLQELAYPEIHRLKNGVSSWHVALGKRFSVRAASKMIAKLLDKAGDHHSADALRTGYYEWLRKRTPQELRELCGLEEPRSQRELREQRKGLSGKSPPGERPSGRRERRKRM